MNVMDQRPQPGAFILETADTGLAVAAGLSCFGASSKVKDLASKVSLSATLLTEIGREVNQNGEFFKNNFQEKFENVMVKCKTEYEVVLAGIEKANSWKKEDSVEGVEDPPRKAWKQLMWALRMDDDEFEEFEEALDESFRQALMLQLVVWLVVLQIRAQKRDLTPSEHNRLRNLKKSMGRLLEALRDADVASVIAFSLADRVNAANVAQVTEALERAAEEECSADSASSTTVSVTIRDSPEEAIPPSDKTEQAVPVVEPPVVVVENKPELRDPDIFEMYRASHKIHPLKTKQTTLRLFGIPFKVHRSEADFIISLDKVPTTDDDIKAFIEKDKTETGNKDGPILQALVNISPVTSTAIYNLIITKNEERAYPRRKWSAERVVPYWWWEKPSRRFWKKQKQTTGYIIVLRGEAIHYPYGPPPPPPGNWPYPGGPPVIVNLSRRRRVNRSVKERKPAGQIDLTQQETENVINDFLASFSTLYDGVTVEERGAALKAIALPDPDDSDSESDDSSSTSSGSSRSLVDD